MTLNYREPHPWDRQADYATGLQPARPAPVAARETGLKRVRPNSRGWRRSARGLYVPASAGDRVEQRIFEQAGRLSEGQAVTGWAALRLLGAGFCDGLASDGRTPLPVPLAVGPQGKLRPTEGSVICHDRLPAEDILWCDRIWVTTVERATFDGMRLARDTRQAVVLLDTVLAAGMLSLDRMSEWLGARQGWKGIRRAWKAVALARVGVRSPKETELRLLAELDLGIIGLLVNHIVVDDGGRRIGEVDLLDADAGMVLEFDGAEHRNASQHARDLAKQQALEEAGLVVGRFTTADLRQRAVAVRRITATSRNAAFTAPECRRWQVEPPQPMVPNRTLAFRLQDAANHRRSRG